MSLQVHPQTVRAALVQRVSLPTFGTDLTWLVRCRPDLAPSLDCYGTVSAYPYWDPAAGYWAADRRQDRRVYVATAELLRNLATVAGGRALRMRTATRYRMAAALLDELANAGTCSGCGGSGLARAPSGGEPCPTCGGSMREPRRCKARAVACGCHYTDFRDGLAAFYGSALVELATVEATALAALLAPPARVH